MRKWMLLSVVLIFFIGGTALAAETLPRVQLSTTLGEIELELNAPRAPKTVANFLSYVDAGHYDGTIFHRVIRDFMVQGGGFTVQMEQKPTQQAVFNEADNGLSNEVGTIAMARTNNPHSATAQFFINVKHNEFLDHRAKTKRGWGYCVFGRVVSGMNVVRAIEAVQTTTRKGMRDVPVKPVQIKKAVRVVAAKKK